MLSFPEIQTIYVHGGVFHADDVCTVAFLRLATHGTIQIQRGLNPPEDAEERGILVADIGNGPFDHHQEPRERRPDGIPYAAFGKVIRAYGMASGLFPGQEDLDRFDRDFVEELDAYDNLGPQSLGGHFQGFCRLVHSLNPLWDEDQSPENAMALFLRAVDIAETFIDREIRNAVSNGRALKLIHEALAKSEDGIIVLDRYLPWKQAAKDAGIRMAVFPSLRGGYMAMSGERSDGTNILIFRGEYRGKKPEELPRGMLFCHSSGFCASFDTLEAAVKGARTMTEETPDNTAP